ncbi:MAG: transposase, partial [Treponema sp.]|nr:transposase [Treponema sp.]
MKSITEIIGGAQGLLDISYNVQDVFEAVQRPMLRSYRGTGRKPYQSQLFSTDTELIQRLKTDSALRLLCGFEKVPGKSTFSRNFGELSATAIM